MDCCEIVLTGATAFPVPWAASAATEPMTQDHMSVPDPLGKSRSASLKREELPFCLPLNSYKSVSAGYLSEPVSVGRRDLPQPRIHLQFPDLPPELQGVSVKDLVKALGQSADYCLNFSVCLIHCC